MIFFQKQSFPTRVVRHFALIAQSSASNNIHFLSSFCVRQQLHLKLQYSLSSLIDRLNHRSRSGQQLHLYFAPFSVQQVEGDNEGIL